MAILGGLLAVLVTVVLLAYSIPILWPILTTASANITAMTGTDEGTAAIQAFWPMILLFIGLGVAVAIIVYVYRRFFSGTF